MDVSIVVVSYNTRDMTLACIRSVIAQTTIDYELIVFDSGSSDGSAAAIRSQFPAVHLIASAANVGFAAANNAAARHAKGRFLLLLNPDTIVLDHAVDRLYAFALSTPKSLIWGGRTVFADGTLNPTSCWRFATPWSIFCWAFGLTTFRDNRLFNWEGYGGWRRDSVRAVDIVTGCFLLIDVELWRRLNGFDPVFFMYGEEADLCLRAHEVGARPMMTPRASIIHHGGASYPDKAERFVHLLTGRVTLMRRHWSPMWCRVGIVLYALLPLIRWNALTIVGLVSKRHVRTARVWRDVWRQRRQWIAGWPGPAAGRV